MDPKTVLLIVGANILALAVGLQRLDTQGIISLDRILPYQFLGQPCGHGRNAFYAIASEHIVLPAGVSSGASESKFCSLTVALFGTTCTNRQGLVGSLSRRWVHRQSASAACRPGPPGSTPDAET